MTIPVDRSGGAEPITSATWADGLTVLEPFLDLATIMAMIEQTARWVDVDTYRRLPIWYPEHFRGSIFYKENWTRPQGKRNLAPGIEPLKRTEGNTNAGRALNRALGMPSPKSKNWACCHIWGVDDGTSNFVVRDRLYYSNIANMVMLPSPLKAFTDVMPTVKAMLRACAYFTYDWFCEDRRLPPHDWASITSMDAYPRSWPTATRRSVATGTVAMTPRIAAAADVRLAEIRRDLVHAGPHYPRDEVREVLRHYGIAAT